MSGQDQGGSYDHHERPGITVPPNGTPPREARAQAHAGTSSDPGLLQFSPGRMREIGYRPVEVRTSSGRRRNGSMTSTDPS